MDRITRTARLPMGFKATFSWSQSSGFCVEWAPAVPRIHSPRQLRKFTQSYQAARRDFFRDVATVVGGAVAVADLTGEYEIVRPDTKH